MTDTGNEDLKFRRRDMLEVEKITGTPFSKLFYQDGADTVATAEGALAMEYVVERRNGLTELSWDDWLDEDAEGLDVEVADDPS